MFKNVIFFLAVAFVFCFEQRPCTKVFCREYATNPCAKITRGCWPFTNQEYFINFCPDAVIFDLCKDVYAPSTCKKPMGGYKRHDFTYSSEYKLSFDVQEENGEVKHYKVDPFYAANDLQDHQIYTRQHIQPLTTSDKSVVKPNTGLDPNTLVKTPFGLQEISDLEIGDTVVCFDFDSQTWTEALVIAVEQSFCDQEMIEINVDGVVVRAGQEQKFYLPMTKEWVAAKDIKVQGQLLCIGCQDDDYGLETVLSVAKVAVQSNKKGIVLTLEKHHNFVANGILVHNSIHAVLNGVISPIVYEFVGGALIALIAGKSFADNSLKNSACVPSDFLPEALACTAAKFVEAHYCHSTHRDSSAWTMDISVCKAFAEDYGRSRSGEGRPGSLFPIIIPIAGAGIFSSFVLNINVSSIAITGTVLFFQWITSKPETKEAMASKCQHAWAGTVKDVIGIKKRYLELQLEDIAIGLGYRQKAIEAVLARLVLMISKAKEAAAAKAALEFLAVSKCASSPAVSVCDDVSKSPPLVGDAISYKHLEECVNDKPFDQESHCRELKFLALRFLSSPLALAKYKLELAQAQVALEKFKAFTNQAAAKDMEISLNKAFADLQSSELALENVSDKIPKEAPEKSYSIIEKCMDVAIDVVKSTLLNEFSLTDALVQNFDDKGFPLTLEMLAMVPFLAVKDLFINPQTCMQACKETGFFYPFKKGGPAKIYVALCPNKDWNISTGDYFYSDHSHKGNHIEIFYGDYAPPALWRKAKDVRNWNGSRNNYKQKQALGLEKKLIKGAIRVYEWIFKPQYFRDIDKVIRRQSDLPDV